MNRPVYKFKDAAFMRVGEDMAQPIGERLEKIRQDGSGLLDPEYIIKDAFLPDSPLHPCFQWDDVIAGHAYRLDQARHLIRAIVIVNGEQAERCGPIRAFVHVGQTEAPGYVSVADASRVLSYRTALMRGALRDLKSYAVRYKLLSDLTGWQAAIQSACSELEDILLQEDMVAPPKVMNG